jgi:D-alanine-D-alanine ligase
MNLSNLRTKKIGVVMGGTSRERDISLRSGGKVLESLKRQGFEVAGLRMSQNLPYELKKEKIDIVFVTLHGGRGEDGTAQGLFEILELPYTGSGVLSSALAMNKVVSKKIWQYEKIPTPPFYEIDIEERLEEQAEQILEDLKLPLIVKPVCEGSSIGVEIVREEKKLVPVLRKAIIEFKNIFIEKFIEGKEVTVGILGVGDKLRALPVLELKSKTGMYDYQAKYTKGLTEFIIPAQIPEKLYKTTQDIALKTHKSLCCSGFSRVDIIVDEATPWVHDLNTIPGLTELSDLPAQAQASGLSYDQLILEILSFASINKT